MSSSGTRLTNEFRYLLDMINIVVWVGWFRVAADGAGLRGRGQGSAGRPTAQRRGLDAGSGRRILSVAGPPVRGGERAVLLGPVVPDRVHPHDLAVAGKLHRIGDDAHLGTAAAPAVTDPIVGAGERHIPGGVHHPGDGQPVGGASRTTAALPQPELLLRVAGVGFAALHVLGDQHVTVEDPHQMIGGDRLDRLPGQHDRHPIAEPG